MSPFSGKVEVARIQVDLQDRQDLSRRYLSEAPHGGIVVEGRTTLSDEDLVSLSIGFQDSGEVVDIRGVVLWCRQSAGGQTSGIGFLPTETDQREQLLTATTPAQENQPYVPTRSVLRYETTLKVTYESASDFVIDYTRNISTGGIFVNSSRPPSLGASILFKLYAPGEPDPIDLPGEVAWRLPGQGFGVRFTGADRNTRKRLDHLVRHVAVGAPASVRAPIYEEINS